MDRRHDSVRLRRQESEKIVFCLALFDLADGLPARPNACEKCERPPFIEREPDVSAFGLIELAERRERRDASALDTEPPSPMRRGDVRTFVTPGSLLRPFRAKTGDGIPQRAVLSSRTPSGALRTIGSA
jgi:hypothetical protein